MPKAHRWGFRMSPLACFSLIALLCSGPIDTSRNARSDYPRIKNALLKWRTLQSQRFSAARSSLLRDSIRTQCMDTVFTILTERIFPAWYGTPWGFYGNTAVPGTGEIACGRFVVRTLQDAGFRMPSRMGDQPSENIIKNLVPASQIQRFPGSAPLEKIAGWIRTQGKGLYMVGLDIHVGFIINWGDSITFCHSSYYDPPLCVVNQPLYRPSPLTDSRYRVVGKLLGTKMADAWLKQEMLPIVYDYFRGQPATTQSGSPTPTPVTRDSLPN